MSKLPPCTYGINRYNAHLIDYSTCIAVHTSIELLWERQILLSTVITIFEFVFYDSALDHGSKTHTVQIRSEPSRLINGQTTRNLIHSAVRTVFDNVDGMCDDWSYDFDRTIAMHHLKTFFDRMQKYGFASTETF